MTQYWAHDLTPEDLDPELTVTAQIIEPPIVWSGDDLDVEVRVSTGSAQFEGTVRMRPDAAGNYGAMVSDSWDGARKLCKRHRAEVEEYVGSWLNSEDWQSLPAARTLSRVPR